ncbi:hypothetical protein CEXT_241861 [Caerostris extrusa]|uniref:Uncharacterized protein n=1 Tax=Caerostris extrusa TaxID=172846 RepID=A0AAV4XUZ5_CAEEX|nr:hypothetical protein CEXT_241861 [Caerostris extrusa]
MRFLSSNEWQLFPAASREKVLHRCGVKGRRDLARVMGGQRVLAWRMVLAGCNYKCPESIHLRWCSYRRFVGADCCSLRRWPPMYSSCSSFLLIEKHAIHHFNTLSHASVNILFRMESIVEFRKGLFALVNTLNY